MKKDEIIKRHAVNFKSLVGTGLAQDECDQIIKQAVNEALILYGVSNCTFTEDDVYNNIAEFVMLYATHDYPSMTKDETLKDIKKLWSELI